MVSVMIRLRQAVGHQRDNARARGRRRGGLINEGDQRRRDGLDGRERLQVDGRNRRRGKRLEMLMHVVSSASRARHRCKESCRREDSLRYHEMKTNLRYKNR